MALLLLCSSFYLGYNYVNNNNSFTNFEKTSAYAQEEPAIWVQTDQTYYTGTFPVIIEGAVYPSQIITRENVALRVDFPDGEVYKQFEVPISKANGTFGYQLYMIEEDLPEGNYQITAQYDDDTAITKFYFSEDPFREKHYSLTLTDEQGQSRSLNIIYSMGYAKLKSIAVGEKKIVIQILPSEKIVDAAVLRLQLPTELVREVFGYEGYSAIFLDGSNTGQPQSPSPSCDYVFTDITFYNNTREITIGVDPEWVSPQQPPRGFTVFPNLRVQGAEFGLMAVTNAQECSFKLVEEEKRLQIEIDQTPSVDESGYMLLRVPRDLLSGDFELHIDGAKKDVLNIDSENGFTVLEFEYPTTTKSIDIIGTESISFPLPTFNGTNLSNSYAPTDDIHLATAANGKYVYAAWKDSVYEEEGKPFEAFFVRSTDEGATFDSPIPLKTSGRSYGFNIDTVSNNVYLTWADNGGLFFARSNDYGASFADTIRITPDETGTFRLAASEENVYIVWTALGRSYNDAGEQFTNLEIFLSSSNDYGITFRDPINISQTNLYSDAPAIAAHGDEVYVVWKEQMNQTNWNSAVFFTASHDGGKHFGEPTALSLEDVNSDLPSLAVARDGKAIYVTWLAYAISDSDNGLQRGVYFTRSIDQGKSFGPLILLSKGTPNPWLVPLMPSPSNEENVYAIWESFVPDENQPSPRNSLIGPSGKLELIFTKSTDTGATFSQPLVISDRFGSDSIARMSIASVQQDNANSEGTSSLQHDIVYVVWNNAPMNRGDVGGIFGQEVFFTKILENETKFSPLLNLNTDTESLAAYPQIESNGGNVYIVWNHLTIGSGSDVLFTRSTDFGRSFDTGASKDDIDTLFEGTMSLSELKAVPLREFTDPHRVCDSCSMGGEYILTATVQNEAPAQQNIVIIVEIRDKEGITQYLAFQMTTLDPEQVSNIGISWTPSNAGTYELRSFVISNFSQPEVLSILHSTFVKIS